MEMHEDYNMEILRLKNDITRLQNENARLKRILEFIKKKLRIYL